MAQAVVTRSSKQERAAQAEKEARLIGQRLASFSEEVLEESQKALDLADRLAALVEEERALMSAGEEDE